MHFTLDLFTLNKKIHLSWVGWREYLTCTAEGERIAPHSQYLCGSDAESSLPTGGFSRLFCTFNSRRFFYQIQFQATMVVLLVYTPPECVSLRGTATLHSILGVEYSTLSITTKIIIKILKYIY